MFKIYRGKRSPTAEVSDDVVRIIDTSKGHGVVFEADADSLIDVLGKWVKLSDVPDDTVLTEWKAGRLRR